MSLVTREEDRERIIIGGLRTQGKLIPCANRSISAAQANEAISDILFIFVYFILYDQKRLLGEKEWTF